MRLLLALVSFGLASLSAPLQAERGLLPNLNVTLPSRDGFYQAPPGYESAAPGTILAYRQIPVPVTFTLLAPVVKSAWQVLYRSTDDLNNPVAAVTTIFVPFDGDPNKFYTQSIAYDSSSNDCSPSYILQTLTDTPPDVAAMALALDNGWFVQSPDFEGLTAAFTNGIVSGQLMLDSLRAGLKSTSFTGILPTARLALNGGSGGALGIEWAIELQQSYAPELKIAGVTLGSLTPNIANVMKTVNGGPFVALVPAAITGLAKVSPTISNYLRDNLIPATASKFMSANTRCLGTNQVYFANQNMSDYFKDPNWLDGDVMTAEVKRIGTMGLHAVPQVPIYVYKGAQDELSDVEDTDALVEKYCHAGAPSIIYVRNIITGHEGESFLGYLGAYEYLQERLNGVPPFQGCVIFNSTQSALNNTDANAVGALGAKVEKIFTSALPTKIGI